MTNEVCLPWSEESIRQIVRDELQRHPFFSPPTAKVCGACGQEYYDLRHWNCKVTPGWQPPESETDANS